MRKTLITAAVAATLFSTAAYAATDTGNIKTLDPTKKEVTLVDGKVFIAPTNWTFASYAVGEKVKVTYHTASGKMLATAIIKVS